MPPFSSNTNILSKSNDHHETLIHYPLSHSNQVPIVEDDEEEIKDDLVPDDQLHKPLDSVKTKSDSFIYIDNANWSIVWTNVIFFIILHAVHIYGIYYLLKVKPFPSWIFCKYN